MGVISKAEPITPIKACESQETLYIPSSDDDRSEVSVEVRHAQARILPTRRAPILTAPSSPGPHCGRKKSRRYLNATTLLTLAEEDEPSEVTIEDFVSSVKTPFTRLMEDEDSLQKWEDFVSSSEEKQNQWISKRSPGSPPKQPQGKKIPPTMKALMKQRCLPLGMVEYLEQELVSFFSNMPRDVYISPELSSFERLLIHSLSDYHALKSMSFNGEPKKVRLVRVKNPKDDFPSPTVLLTDYLSCLS